MKRIVSLITALLIFASLMTGSVFAVDEADEISVSDWTFEASSTNTNNGKPLEVPERVIDGNTNTHWHTMIEPKAEGPHYITVILPSVTDVGGYRYYPRTDNNRVGVCTKYEIYVSADGTNYEKAAQGTWANDADAKTVKFGKNYRAKYIRLQLVEAVGGYGSAGEIRLLKADKTKQTVNVTGKIQAKDISGSTSTPKTEEQPKEDTGKISGEGELSTDGWTFEVSSTNTNFGKPLEVPERVIDGSTKTFWHTMIEPKAEGPHYITVILPSVTEVGGYRYYPRTDNNRIGVCTKYEIYVSADGKNYEKAVQGTWASDTDEKTVKFSKNYRAKYIRLQMIESEKGYGSAGEIRLLKPDKAKQTVNVTGTIQAKDILAGAVSKKTEEIKEPESKMTGDGELPTDGWTFETSSTNTNNGVPTEVPERIIDGKTETFWHTMIEPKAEAPHYITVILPKEEYVSGYHYYPRTDNNRAGVCTKYEIYVSEDGKDFTLSAEGSWASSNNMKTADFGVNVKVKAVKLVMTEAVGGYGSAGEIRLSGPKDSYKNMTVSEYKVSYEDIVLKAVLFDSMNIYATGNSARPVTNMADGYSESYWHTEMVSGKLPQDITYNFHYAYTVDGLRYVPRQDGNLTGHFLKFDVLVSDNGVDFNLLKSFETTASAEEKDFMFDSPVKTKYMRIHLKEGLYGYGTCAELYFLQNGRQYKEDEANGEETYTLKIGDENVKVKKDGEEKTLTFDTAPFIYGGSTMIPLRGLMEEMGMSVDWNGGVQQIDIYDEYTEMILYIEDDRVYIDNIRYNAVAAPMIRDSRTFIPLRFMSEQMGYKVYWDGEKQEIKISTK